MKTPDIKWINQNKVRKTISNISFAEDLVYSAHSQESPGFVPYVPKRVLDSVIEENLDMKKRIEELEAQR